MNNDIHTEALLDIISKGLWAQKEPEILAYWAGDPEEVRATYRREAAELMKREDMARAWDEGAEVAWANRTPQWNGHTQAPQFPDFRETNADIDNPYE